MGNRVTKLLGIEYPILAFSHCRDVVIEVSKAGGMGVLGTSRSTPEQVEIDLRTIESALGGRPYGVDLVFPLSDTGEPLEEMQSRIPEEHRKFVDDLLVKYQVPPPRHSLTDEARNAISGAKNTSSWSLEIADAVFQHRPRLVASALGPAPEQVKREIRSIDSVLCGLAGSVAQARRQAESGVEIIVAQGTESGGHMGKIGTLVLVPDVVDAFPEIPILAAGGIGDGRQIAASMALGAEGVWTGSIWLTTVESDLDPAVKQRLLAATSRDAVVSLCLDGKPVRQLKTPWVDAWESPGAPKALPMPLQGLLVREANARIFGNRVEELMGTAVGQVVGRMNRVSTARQVLLDLAEGFVDTCAKLGTIIDDY